MASCGWSRRTHLSKMKGLGRLVRQGETIFASSFLYMCYEYVINNCLPKRCGRYSR